MDVVVNAVWLAYYWAKVEEDKNAASALESLILDWPMDFILIEGSTPEEIEQNKFLWGVNQSAKVERHRDIIGLDSSNLMRIVAKAAEFAKSPLSGGQVGERSTRPGMAESARELGSVALSQQGDRREAPDELESHPK